ncbi:MAG TPA: OmpA family protein [Nitrospiraceae bacterium]|nr:OmpA family protein [Nitrospiraceae bacterium]
MKPRTLLIFILGAAAIGCSSHPLGSQSPVNSSGNASSASPSPSAASPEAQQVLALQQERQQLLATLGEFHERIRELESKLADREGKPIAKSYDELLAIKEAELQELRKASAENATLAVQHDATMKELVQAKQRLGTLDQELARKEQELTAVRGLTAAAAELDSTKRRAADLESTLMQRDNEVRALRGAAAERGSLGTQLQTATVTLNHTKTRLAAVEKQLLQKDQDLRISASEKQRLSAESAAYAADLKQARQRITVLEQHAADGEQQVQVLKRTGGDRDRLASQLTAANMDLTQLKQRASQLERQLAAKNQETDTLRSLVTEKDAQLRQVPPPKEVPRRSSAATPPVSSKDGSQVTAFNKIPVPKSGGTGPGRKPAPPNPTTSKSADQPYAKLSQTKDELLMTLQDTMVKGAITLKQEGNQLSVSLSSSLLFAPGDVRLKPDGTTMLKRIGQIIGQASNRAIQVTGHTDNQAIREELKKAFPDNRALSWARADSARKALISGGTPSEHIRAIGLADKKPLASNTTEAGRQKNRRIEIVVTQFSTPARTMTTGAVNNGPSMAALSLPSRHDIR